MVHCQHRGSIRTSCVRGLVQHGGGIGHSSAEWRPSVRLRTEQNRLPVHWRQPRPGQAWGRVIGGSFLSRLPAAGVCLPSGVRSAGDRWAGTGSRGSAVLRVHPVPPPRRLTAVRPVEGGAHPGISAL
jgi:hypothetical protein